VPCFTQLHKAVIERLRRLRVLGPGGFEETVSGLCKGDVGGLLRVRSATVDKSLTQQTVQIASGVGGIAVVAMSH
jgi:hypothetical protein